MIKNIAYFPSQCAQNSGPVISAVLDFLQARGIQTQENSLASDAAVIWSVLWSGRMAANRAVYEHYRAHGRPVIVLEIGALYRGQTWKVAVNHITRDGYYGHEQNLDWDRPRRLNISLAHKFDGDPAVVIAAQHSRSLQTQTLGDMTHWVVQQIQQVRAHTDRPIKIRPHPRSRLELTRLPTDVVIEQPRSVPNTYDSFDMHFDCHAVVNYNSGPGIQAAISGVRPVVNQTSLAYPVSVELANIEQPYDIDRESWLIELCHTEYTLNEIERGQWIDRLRLQ